ncbi:MAG: GDP-mannose 4,6-dehydratase [Candidatus Promineifilaceae bacterium]|nr:GDP-mannose 4,6-dehydratase [Candidatus Promineifilaceae bacterium]
MKPGLISRPGFWRDRRVLVTGCTGFLGSWLTAALVELGAEVVGLVRDQIPQAQLFQSGTAEQVITINGQLADFELLERVIAEYEIDTIFHLAAQTIVGIANRSPLSTFETNIRGSWLLLEAARRNPTVTRVIVASSEKAYGEPQYLPLREEHPLHGRHPYDVSKSAVDLIAQSYAATYQMPVVISRFSNLYGGGDLNWNRLLPGTMRSVLRGKRPIIRSDGSFKRDYVYVEDAVRAYLMLAEKADDSGLWGQAVNFGSGCPVTALEVVQTIIRVSDYPSLLPIILDEVENEIRDEYLSADRAWVLLGWEPAETLQSGLEKTMQWYETYLKNRAAGELELTE